MNEAVTISACFRKSAQLPANTTAQSDARDEAARAAGRERWLLVSGEVPQSKEVRHGSCA